jgi:hypothetical protein
VLIARPQRSHIEGRDQRYTGLPGCERVVQHALICCRARSSRACRARATLCCERRDARRDVHCSCHNVDVGCNAVSDSIRPNLSGRPHATFVHRVRLGWRDRQPASSGSRLSTETSLVARLCHGSLASAVREQLQAFTWTRTRCRRRDAARRRTRWQQQPRPISPRWRSGRGWGEAPTAMAIACRDRRSARP